jgi:hypothetical protein
MTPQQPFLSQLMKTAPLDPQQPHRFLLRNPMAIERIQDLFHKFHWQSFMNPLPHPESILDQSSLQRQYELLSHPKTSF